MDRGALPPVEFARLRMPYGTKEIAAWVAVLINAADGLSANDVIVALDIYRQTIGRMEAVKPVYDDDLATMNEEGSA